MRQRKRFPFSVENTFVIIVLIISLCFMFFGCTIEETCYSPTETMNDPFTGEVVPLPIDCE